MNRLSLRKRQGFTLVELLVVIAIIAVLIGLLLPAVQQARSAALRTQTTNNLHQVALASVAFHDVNGWLPYNGNTIGSGTTESGSWAYQILPYMEQQNVYSIQTSTTMLANWTSDGTPTGSLYGPVNTLLDPMRPRPGYYSGSYTTSLLASASLAIAKADGPADAVALGNLPPDELVVAVTTMIALSPASVSLATATISKATAIKATTTVNASGPATDFGINPYLNSPPTVTASASVDAAATISGGGTLGAVNNHRALTQITDGTSNTILVGEMYCAISDYSLTTPAQTTRLPIFYGGQAATARNGLGDTATTWRQDGTASTSNQWGGPMSNGALMAMADGSVHLIPYNTPLTNLLEPNDGNAVIVP